MWASYHMNLESEHIEPKVGTWDGKVLFPYIHASKTQEFNCKMNVIQVNL